MNENQTPDDLPGHLDALGQSLQRPPRSDARVEALVGMAPPALGLSDSEPTSPLVLPLAAPAPKRRVPWVAVAAALSLLAGIGVVAYALADDDAVQPAIAADGDDDGDADGDGSEEIEPPAESADSLDDHHAWLECVTDQLKTMFEDGFSSRDGRFSPLDECGEPPAWLPFVELPEFDDWPDLGMLPDLGELKSLDDICSSESTESGVDVACLWPPCDDGEAETDCPFPPACTDDREGGEATSCFGFDFGFGLEMDPEGFGFSVPFEGLGQFFFDPETFPELPDDFEFPRDLPRLGEWFEDFPWHEGTDGLFEAPEAADA